jgi:hypothetical protein
MNRLHRIRVTWGLVRRLPQLLLSFRIYMNIVESKYHQQHFSNVALSVNKRPEISGMRTFIVRKRNYYLLFFRVNHRHMLSVYLLFFSP